MQQIITSSQIYVPRGNKIVPVEMELPPDTMFRDDCTYFVEHRKLITYHVSLTSEDHEAARAYALRAWTNQKPSGNYNDGLTKDPIVVGKLGEIGTAALCKWVVDVSRREGGDETDFYLYNCKIDVKTAHAESGKNGLILSRRWNGTTWRPVILKSDTYLFAKMLDNEYTTVCILGYIDKEDALRVDKTRPRGAIDGKSTFDGYCDVKNLEIQYTELHPLTDLGITLNLSDE